VLGVFDVGSCLWLEARIGLKWPDWVAFSEAVQTRCVEQARNP